MTTTERTGLLIVNTGDGKGKTTAALGMVLRAWGQGLRVCVIQFIKSSTGHWGEVRAAERLGIDWVSCGDGFTRRSKDPAATAARAVAGWEMARDRIAGGAYDLVVLDEFTYPLAYGWLDADEVVGWLVTQRPADVHVVVTGRDAPESLVARADLVTRMEDVRHPYRRGVRAQPGIEF